MSLRRLALVLALLPSAALAQHAGYPHGGGTGHHSRVGAAAPYAGFATREAAGLSEAEIADLRAGRGMGLALPAELNGYPGPLHALELAEALDLSPVQRETMARLIAAMRAETIPLGEQVIAAERALDQVFASGAATQEAILDATRRVASTRAELRAAHLRIHLTTRDALTVVQRTRYAALRGYGPGGAPVAHDGQSATP